MRENSVNRAAGEYSCGSDGGTQRHDQARRQESRPYAARQDTNGGTHQGQSNGGPQSRDLAQAASNHHSVCAEDDQDGCTESSLYADRQGDGGGDRRTDAISDTECA